MARRTSGIHGSSEETSKIFHEESGMSGLPVENCSEDVAVGGAKDEIVAVQVAVGDDERLVKLFLQLLPHRDHAVPSHRGHEPILLPHEPIVSHGIESHEATLRHVLECSHDLLRKVFQRSLGASPHLCTIYIFETVGGERNREKWTPNPCS